MKKALDFFDNRQRRQTEIREADKALHDEYTRVLGLEKMSGKRAEYIVNRKMARDQRRVHDIFLGRKNLYSMSQIRQLWMYMQDPSLTKRLKNMGIDEGVMARVNQIMAENPQDQQIAKWVLERFQSDFEYNRNNEVYRKVYGTDLPRLDNYVPIRSEWYQNRAQQEGAETDVLPQYTMDMAMRANAETARAIKGRAKNADKSRLLITGDTGLYSGWQQELAHFRNYAEKVRVARAVLEDRDFKNAVVSEYGEHTWKLLDAHLKDIAANGSLASTNIPIIDNIRSAWVSSNIGMSFSVFLKQWISVVNYWQHMPSIDGVKGMAKFWTNPKKHFREMQEIWNSDYLKNRRFTGIDRDFLSSTMGSNAYNRFKINPTAENLFTLNVRVGDNFAIMVGGWLLYNHYKNSTNHQFGKRLTHDQALREMARASEQTQQSSAIEEQSFLQRGGTFAKMMTTYSTGPVQVIRQ